MNAKGFSLIEAMVYGALLALLSLLVFHFFTHASRIMHQYRTSNTQVAMLQSAAHVFTNDIMHGESQAGLWKCETGKRISWTTHQGVIRWKCKNNTLYRSLYSDGKKRNKTTAVVAQNIASCSWEITKEDASITQVFFTIIPNNGSPISFTVPVRNRMV